MSQNSASFSIPKLLFIVGKGGVGRTTLSTSLAASLAAKGLNVLVVQWALRDSISPLYSLSECGHKESTIPDGFKIMNFKANEAIREYFVEHLKMKLLYSVVIENKYVQKLVQAAPGIQELFFLGRLFWLVELAEKERGYHYDHVIVDTPATGHGVSLFTMAPAIAKLGITGPLATECERVTKLLADREKTGIFLVTLPEELPVEESFDFITKLTKQIDMPPLGIFINQSLNTSLSPSLADIAQENWFHSLKNSLENSLSQQELDLVLETLLKRNKFELKLRNWLKRFADTNPEIPVLSLPDVNLIQKQITPRFIVKTLANYLTFYIDSKTRVTNNETAEHFRGV